MDQKKQGQQSEEFEDQQPQPASQEKGRGEGGGITNRDLDREMDEQDELPDRGTSRDDSDRDDSER